MKINFHRFNQIIHLLIGIIFGLKTYFRHLQDLLPGSHIRMYNRFSRLKNETVAYGKWMDTATETEVSIS